MCLSRWPMRGLCVEAYDCERINMSSCDGKITLDPKASCRVLPVRGKDSCVYFYESPFSYWNLNASGGALVVDATYAAAGANRHYLLTFGDNTNKKLEIPPQITEAHDLGFGANYGCGLTKDGEAKCWGDNMDGRATPP